MSYEKVSQAKEIIIGTKQTVRALKSGDVQEVIIAADADQRIKNNIVEIANEIGISYTMVDSMKKLGKSCGIDVGAAAVAILK